LAIGLWFCLAVEGTPPFQSRVCFDFVKLKYSIGLDSQIVTTNAQHSYYFLIKKLTISYRKLAEKSSGLAATIPFERSF
jgi:hypothetical protein